VKTLANFLCLIFLLSACGPSPEQQATMTATAQTATAAAWTPTPTTTSTPTYTPSPTLTETPTPTLTPTATASPTSTSSPTPTQEADRYYPPDNSFSILIPANWQTVDLGIEYPGLLGPQVEGITQNLVFVRETYGFPLAFYTALVQDKIITNVESLTSISEDFLATSTGLDYFRWITERTEQSTRLRQIYYIFENGDFKLTIIYTRQSGEAPEQDAIIAGSLDTFSFEP
jgi:hypothetical protein